jgi:hypothetical protein
MPYLESEQQDETMNVAECDSEKAEVTDAQETTANEHLSMLSHSGHLSIGLSIFINASVFSRLELKPSGFF